MSYGLGIDIGTTYTAAAVWRAGRAAVFDLGTHSSVVPTVVLARDDGTLLVGEPAERRGLVEPQRFAREFKRRLGDPTPLVLGGTPWSAEALTAEVLRTVVDLATEREGEPPAAVALTYPATWGPYKRDLLAGAIRRIGLEDVALVPEPEAAAIHYASQERVATGTVVAVYDLGGGTFDAAVLRKGADGWAILGPPRGLDHLGGVDFDQAVFDHVDRALGEALTDLDPGDPHAVAALVRLRRDCVGAKEALSSDTYADIPMLLGGDHRTVRLTRREFEAMVRPALEHTAAELARTLEAARTSPADVDSVLLVGGSSRIPLVSQLVGAALGRPVAVDAHPKHGTALGAALLTGESLAAVAAAAAPPRPADPPSGEALPPPPIGPPPPGPSSVPPPPGAPGWNPPTSVPPGRARPARRRAVAVGATMAVLVALLAWVATRGGGDGEEGGGEEGGGDGTAAALSQSLSWAPCRGGGMECAAVTVPVDHDDPGGDTLELDVLRAPATGERVGALFAQPGGLGDLVDLHTATISVGLPAQLLESFDIVGVEARTLDAGAPDCGGAAEMRAADPTPDTPGEEGALVAAAEEYAAACDAAGGARLGHFGAADLARDIDLVRSLMGDEQSSLVTQGPGSAVADAYLTLFPDRLRSLVLDHPWQVGAPGPEAALAQAAYAERLLTDFIATCDADPACLLAPDAGAAIDELVAQVDEAPIPASPRALGQTELIFGLVQGVYGPWDEFATVLAAARSGDAAPLMEQVENYEFRLDDDAYFAMNCLDAAWPDSPDELLADAAAAGEEAPHIGQAYVAEYLPCVTWPAPSEPLEPADGSTAPPTLVIAQTDPADDLQGSPYRQAQEAAQRLGGTLLAASGTLNPTFGNANTCIDEAVAAFVVDGTAPATGTTCP